MLFKKKIVIIVPVLNEAENIPFFIENVKENTRELSTIYNFNLLFIDDGSTDNTLTILQQMSSANDDVLYIELSRNFGHQFAIKAGIDNVVADAVIFMDGDMQHPPRLLPALIQEWQKGFDIVFTIRAEDKKLPFFKRITSTLFYKIINSLSDVAIIKGAADFKLIDKNALNVLKKINETDLFLRGITSWIGFKQTSISYNPDERFAGRSKYTFKKMISLAIQGIVSFSNKPLYAVIYLGVFISILSICIYTLYLWYSFYHHQSVTGWASVISTIVFFGGLNLVVMGIIGIYIGKLFIQSKGRPLYIIKSANQPIE